jgi:hypothetical protein
MVAKGKLLNTPNSKDNQHHCQHIALLQQYLSDTQLATNLLHIRQQRL